MCWSREQSRLMLNLWLQGNVADTITQRSDVFQFTRDHLKIHLGHWLRDMQQSLPPLPADQRVVKELFPVALTELPTVTKLIAIAAILADHDLYLSPEERDLDDLQWQRLASLLLSPEVIVARELQPTTTETWPAIEVYQRQDGRYDLYNGGHRLYAAWLLGHQHIRATIHKLG